MEMSEFKHWYVPVTEGMEVKVHTTSDRFDRYHEQSNGDVGIIVKINLTQAQSDVWKLHEYNNMHLINVEWKNGQKNIYRLSDLIPTGNFQQGQEVIVLTNDAEIKKVGNYMQKLVESLVEYGHSIRETKVEGGFNKYHYMEKLNRTLAYLEGELINGTAKDYYADMINAIYDKRDELANHTEQEQEDAESGSRTS